MSNLEPSQIVRLYWLLFALATSCFVLLVSAALLLYRRQQQQQGQPDYELSQAEAAELAASQAKARADRQFYRAVLQEARVLLKEIPHHLAIQNRFESFYVQGQVSERARHTRGGQKRRVRRIAFEAVLITRTEIWFRIDGRKLPSGTSFFDLKNPNSHVMENLQYGIGRPCRYAEDNFFNLFIRIGLRNSLMGVPKMVYWRNVVADLPKTIPFAVPIGVNEYNKLIYQDITKWPHGLILGGTGGGKSTGLKQILISLIMRNSPSNLRMYLVDLKRTELPNFAAVPHVAAFVNRVHDVQPVLEELYGEMERRLSLFENVCNDISGWNRQQPQRRLARILFVVDELAILTRNAKYRGAALEKLLELVALGRAVGIHLLLCTQTVTKEVLSTDILANVDGRVCYSVRNMPASILAVGNGTAVGLQPPGRCVFIDGINDMYLQTPYADDADIEKAIKESIEKYAKEGITDESPLSFLARLGLENYGGIMGYRSLFKDTQNTGEDGKNKLSQAQITKLLVAAEFDPDRGDDNIIEVAGHGRFILTPGKVIHNKQPRMLLPVNGHVPDVPEIVITLEERWRDLHKKHEDDDPLVVSAEVIEDTN